MADWKRMSRKAMADDITPEDEAQVQAMLASRVVVCNHMLEDGATVEVTKTVGPWPGLGGLGHVPRLARLLVRTSAHALAVRCAPERSGDTRNRLAQDPNLALPG